jgi:hypothetical protein
MTLIFSLLWFRLKRGKGDAANLQPKGYEVEVILDQPAHFEVIGVAVSKVGNQTGYEIPLRLTLKRDRFGQSDCLGEGTTWGSQGNSRFIQQTMVVSPVMV